MHRQIRLVMYILIGLSFMLAIALAASRANSEETRERGKPQNGHAAPVSYPYKQLNDRQKALYDALYAGIAAHDETIALPDTYKRAEYEKVYLLVSMQEPEFFYLDEVYETADMMRTANMHYVCGKAEAEQMRTSLEMAADSIIDKISPVQTDGQKMLVIHDEIAQRCIYMAPTDMPDGAYTALVEGVARCEGYAKAFAYVCRRAGIDVMMVTGQSDRGYNHVWNKADFDGEYYNVDVTWDDDDSYYGNVAHTCFGMPDAVFGDHIPDHRGYIPPPSGMGVVQTYYYQRNLQVRELPAFPGQIRQWIADANGSMTEFRCADTVTFETVYKKLKEEPELMAGRNTEMWTIVCDRNRQVIAILP